MSILFPFSLLTTFYFYLSLSLHFTYHKLETLVPGVCRCMVLLRFKTDYPFVVFQDDFVWCVPTELIECFEQLIAVTVEQLHTH